jgi:hypothetical protein
LGKILGIKLELGIVYKIIKFESGILDLKLTFEEKNDSFVLKKLISILTKNSYLETFFR